MISRLLRSLIIFCAVVSVVCCGDAGEEARLVELFTVASLDVAEIRFPADSTETVISVDSYFDYSIEGLKSDFMETVVIESGVAWSISDGAVSTIDQNGRLTTGSIAETVTITARFGFLEISRMITVSDAKFDGVVALNDTTVVADMCQATSIEPVGRYINDDMSTEVRRVDNADIDAIEWIIRNKEDDSPSQRVLIVTDSDVTRLHGLAAGDVVIQAQAESRFSNSIVTSADFDQAIGNSLNSIKLCSATTTDLSTCDLDGITLEQGGSESVIAVGNFRASDGTNYDQNISEFSKWGVDDTANVSIALPADRQQLDVTGELSNTMASLTVACGQAEQTVTADQLRDGVVLAEPVSCDPLNLDCYSDSVVVDVDDQIVESLSVEANGDALVDDELLLLTGRPATIVLQVTATFTSSGDADITDDDNVTYINNNTGVVTEVTDAAGEYSVIAGGDVDIQIVYRGLEFRARIRVP